MRAVCLIDTSVFVEILEVPMVGKDPKRYQELLQRKIQDQEALFLPFATIFETGNHIAQHGRGQQRRAVAQRFVNQVERALAGHSPFQPTKIPPMQTVSAWLSEFPDRAMEKMGLADLSIKAEWEALCQRYTRNYRVYVWSKDRHLLSCDRPAI